MAFALQNLFNAASRGLQRLRFNAWTLGGRGAEIFEKSAEALQLERMNPLRGIDEWRLGQIFDDARDGIYADLAWLYNEIEGIEPALVACCDMRESAAGECGWLVKTADADRTRGFDANLADEQRVALLEEFGAVEDDLADVAEHLVSAFFRGAAHALPLWNADGTLAGFRRLDLWNMAFDRQTGIWYWNADASRDEQTFQAIPPGEIVSLAVSGSRHVDHAALPIFIRAALGAKRYGVWLDRFGIPPVAVIMPPNAEKGEQANYMDLARKFSRGGNGILPNGSAVTYGTEARAVCPFLDFIRFQQQQIYTVGIGRVQSGDSQGANLGGNAAGVVEDGFRRIVRRDARRIARAINDCVTRKVIARLFPGRPVLAQFAWDTEVKRTSREVLEDAGLARTAGLAIDLDQVQELTGYKLEKAPETPLPAPGFGLNSRKDGKTPLQTRENALQNAPRGLNGHGEGAGDGALVEALEGLYEKSLAEAAAEEFEWEGLTRRRGEAESAEEVANEITNPCPKCHHQMRADGGCTHCEMVANHAKGKTALGEALSKKADVVNAMKRDSIGSIDFLWGNIGTPAKGYHDGEGISHIQHNHPNDLQQMPGVVAFGDVYDMPDENKYYIVKRRRIVVLRKQTGSNHYVITGFEADDPNKVKDIRKRGKLVEKGEA